MNVIFQLSSIGIRLHSNSLTTRALFSFKLSEMKSIFFINESAVKATASLFRQ